MNPRLLRTFLALARLRNFTRAAQEVHLAQSSVSDQIQALEADVGAALFIRSKSGLKMTPAGEALRPYAEELLAVEDEARAAIANAAESNGGMLAIGALETIASMRLAPWLADFTAANPGIDIKLRIAGSDELLAKLEQGEIDIALCFHDGEPDERFVTRVVGMEPLVLVGSPDRGDLDPRTDLAALSAENFVVTEPGCTYRRMFDRAFIEAGLDAPKLVAEVGSISSIARFVASGVGLGFVPHLAVSEALEQGSIRELRWPGTPQAAALTMIWRRRRVQPPVLRRFIAAATEHFATVRPNGGHPPHAG